MPSVGIIANPASGTDIRRLVALGTVVGTQEKINIVQRILVGLEAAGVGRFYVMPDLFGIGRTALNRLPRHLARLRERAVFLDMDIENSASDSERAAGLLRDLGVGCIVVLGGDGTNRVVAKGCGQVPIAPVSTGTNNVIPYFVEGTVAGLAAGFVARHPGMLPNVAQRGKRLLIQVDGGGGGERSGRHNGAADTALVDVAVVEGMAVASRSVWDPALLRQVVLARAEPNATGISSLGGFLAPVPPDEPRGLCLRLGEPRICQVTAPLAPGLMATFGVEAMRTLSIGDTVSVQGGNRLLALDGEREHYLRHDQTARITLQDDGPWFVDPERALEQAVARGEFAFWREGHWNGDAAAAGGGR